MDNDNKFWIFTWSIIASVLITIILSITTYSFHQANILNEMVKNGADPITARCSLLGSEHAPGQAIICAMQAGVISK